MSSKNIKKKKPVGRSGSGRSKNARKQARTRRVLWIAIIILGVMLALLIGFAMSLRQEESGFVPETTVPTEVSTETSSDASTSGTETETEPEEEMHLGNGLVITEIDSYSGIFVEDGSDEFVTGVLMINVKNTGDEAIQYAEITMDAGGETAYFSMSTIPAGASVILLEQNRMAYSDQVAYSNPAVDKLAVFTEPMNVYEDLLDIQILEGAINVKNISGEDITDDIFIYYKNYTADRFYGGITYRIRIEGGLKADEVRQMMASHFYESGSAILFVSFGA